MNTDRSDVRAHGDDKAAPADTGSITAAGAGEPAAAPGQTAAAAAPAPSGAPSSAAAPAATASAATVAAPASGEPEDGQWVALPAKRIARASRIRLLVPTAALLIAAVFTPSAGRYILGGLGIALYAYGFIVAGRTARTWRYLERADDLLIEHGVVFQRKLAVPYGRMQYIDIAIGPVERLLGIASIRLHTASTETRAHVPGLSPQDAEALRDRLARRGQARMTAL